MIAELMCGSSLSNFKSVNGERVWCFVLTVNIIEHSVCNVFHGVTCLSVCVGDSLFSACLVSELVCVVGRVISQTGSVKSMIVHAP